MCQCNYRFAVESRPRNYERVRQNIAEGMSSRFVGWDSELDRQFDWHSRFFLLYQDDDIVAGLRLVLSGSFWPQTQLPAESANGTLDALARDMTNVGEFSGFRRSCELENNGGRTAHP